MVKLIINDIPDSISAHIYYSESLICDIFITYKSPSYYEIPQLKIRKNEPIENKYAATILMCSLLLHHNLVSSLDNIDEIIIKSPYNYDASIIKDNLIYSVICHFCGNKNVIVMDNGSLFIERKLIKKE